MASEEPLGAGLSTEGVVRVGDTVRRPVGPWTPAVHAFLRHLEVEGFPAAPRVLGVDEQDREILTFARGTPADREDLVPDERLHHAARLVADLHRGSARFVPPAGARWRSPRADPGGGPIILHGDLGGWNVVIDRDHLTFIDWDDAGPGRPEWEAGHCLLSFADLWPDSVLSDAEAARRIDVFADGYGLTRARLEYVLRLVPDRCRWMSEDIRTRADRGQGPASRLVQAGTPPVWAATAEHWRTRLSAWIRLLSSR